MTSADPSAGICRGGRAISDKGPGGAHPLDDVDRRIIAELSADARLSVRRLAERVHVSRTAAHTRLSRLLDAGVITGFAAQVDRKAIGLNISAVIVIQVGDVPWPEISAELAALPFVEKVQAVSGDVDALVTVNAPDHNQLSQVILRRIHEIRGVVSSRSLIILEDLPGSAPGSIPD